MLTKKGEVTKESLDYFDKLTHSLKSLEYIMKSEDGGNSYGYSRNYANEYSGEGYSRARYRMPMGGSSYGENSYESDASYARRGRDGDGDGRYSERGHSMNYSERNSYEYSRHTAKEHMIQKLTDMMEDASTEEERKALKRCISQLS